MSLNIVCLHGFTQNSEKMKNNLENLVKDIPNLTLTYQDGSVKLPNHAGKVNPRAYWITDPDNPTKIIWDKLADLNIKFFHLNDSLDELIELSNKLERIDGIIGFSQGGCFADYVCKLITLNRSPLKIKFCIFISAMKFDRPDYLSSCDEIYPELKTLHIIGKNDILIKPEVSVRLAESYPNKIIYHHDGAHNIPCSDEAKEIVMKFLNDLNNC